MEQDLHHTIEVAISATNFVSEMTLAIKSVC